MKSFHSTSAMSAMPIGAPGWPELAFCTASMLSARMALASSLREDMSPSSVSGYQSFPLAAARLSDNPGGPRRGGAGVGRPGLRTCRMYGLRAAVPRVPGPLPPRVPVHPGPGKPGVALGGDDEGTQKAAYSGPNPAPPQNNCAYVPKKYFISSEYSYGAWTGAPGS
jgi:hypothetical protein